MPAAKWKSCGRPVSAATALTVALKISFDHCAGRRSSNASAFSPAERINSATDSASAGVVSRYGPIQVAVSSTYSTCESSCRVPLMKVTAERSGHAPCAATTSSAPSPFCAVMTVAFAKRPASDAASGSRSPPLHARITRSASPSSAGSVEATTRAVKSERPETRRPCSFSVRACSSRRVSTATSATRARCAAKRLPIVPAPATTILIGASTRARARVRR